MVKIQNKELKNYNDKSNFNFDNKNLNDLVPQPLPLIPKDFLLEVKVAWETKKILDPSIEVQATCARVPVINGHSEAVFFRTEKKATKPEILELLESSNGPIP